MKIHKRKTLFGLIYALVMLLPLSSVLFRCAYTIFNKNAFESYYGETINEVEYKETTNLIKDKNYKWESNNYTNIFADTNNAYIKVNGIHEVQSNDTNTANNLITYENQIIYLYFINNGTTNSGISFRSENNTQLVPVGIHNKELSFEFQVIEFNNIGNDILSCIYSIEYNKYSYLDNAFEYSLDRFIGINGRGVLNLTDWFTDVFLQRSQHTMLYLDFINWYMNYTLLVSCVYLLYLVLMWFISLARRILCKYMED